MILDAAERLFAERGPDRVSVLDVAVAAGVSHSLVLHYFKTYSDLVRSVLTRRSRAVVQEIKRYLAEHDGAAPDGGPEALLGLFLRTVCEPTHARLLAWAALSGEGRRLKLVESHGLAPIVELFFTRLSRRRRAAPRARAGAAAQTAAPRRPPLTRERVEEAILIALAAVHGYATGKSVYLPVLGHSEAQSPDLDSRFRTGLATMLRCYLGAED